MKMLNQVGKTAFQKALEASKDSAFRPACNLFSIVPPSLYNEKENSRRSSLFFADDAALAVIDLTTERMAIDEGTAVPVCFGLPRWNKLTH